MRADAVNQNLAFLAKERQAEDCPRCLFCCANLNVNCINSFRGSFGGFNQFPKFWIFLERFVLGGFESGAEEEILERMPAENPVDEHAQLVSLKINTIITDAEPVQNASAPFQFAEFIQLGAAHLLRQAAKFTENLQLEFLGHPRQFGGTRWRKDDLKRGHRRLRVEG
jgi:hypothetical protein